MDDSTAIPAKIDARISSALEEIQKSATSALEALQRSPASNNAEASLTLLKIAAETGKLEAEGAKAKHEAHKIEIDASLAKKQLGLSFLSTITSQLVPLAALLTVAVTFYGSYQQSKQTRELEAKKASAEQERQERLEWEAFRGDFDKFSADELYKKPTFIAKLKAFVASGKHSAEIFDISRPLLGELTSRSAFVEVWNNTYKTIDSANIDNVIYIAKAQRNKYFRVSFDCGNIPIPPNTISVVNAWIGMGPCYTGYARDAVAKAYADKPELAKRVFDWREQVSGVTSILAFLSERLSDYLKTSSKSGPLSYDLSEIILYASNVDGVDFSKTNLSQTRFYQMSLKGAKFDGPYPQMLYDLPASSWWEASSFNPVVLRFLITNYYPGSDYQLYNPQLPTLTEDKYREAIKRLCVPQASWCETSCVRYGKSLDPLPDVCSK